MPNGSAGNGLPLSCFVNGKLYFSLSVQCLYEKASKGCYYIYSKCPRSNFTLHRVFILILGYNSSVPFLEEKSTTQQCYQTAFNDIVLSIGRIINDSVLG